MSKRLKRAVGILFRAVRGAVEEIRQPGLANEGDDGVEPRTIPDYAQQRVEAAEKVRARCHDERKRAGGKPEEFAWVKACREADAELVVALRERGMLGDDHRAIGIEDESERLLGKATPPVREPMIDVACEWTGEQALADGDRQSAWPKGVRVGRWFDTSGAKAANPNIGKVVRVEGFVRSADGVERAVCEDDRGVSYRFAAWQFDGPSSQLTALIEGRTNSPARAGE